MSRFLIQLDWDDAPHLSDEVKKELLASIPEYQRDARSKGIPQLGSGAIYPIPQIDIEIGDIEIPEHWERWYGMDVGWNATAVVWFARNPDTDERYITSVYKMGKEKPIVHASAIKARGAWVKGAVDPASRGRSQEDGRQLLQTYMDEGLHLTCADNAVESGLYKVWQLLATGQLKVFKSCAPWWDEFRIYRRDDKGKVVKEKDHLMDAMRYGIMSENEVADVPISRRKTKKVNEAPGMSHASSGNNWMGRV
ncbi:MAG TPA: hypothetical protein VIM16_00915 [Mucilaginibacter sp.]|jgi:hypothetical protein